ncbi:hypothetical protein [Rhodococcus rhodnii]|uniref:Uncharacterized protein n=1 Tax=Rhodococcus rhodnii LMG 5362 TaxID=1273125 RepID=R7WQR1_9NOCA|nr:hypothetical protein [Rhodococcus rhodnii]EOM77662.1 hypothetical protein Rrhod_0981 [Rhodococcus rhodnii LMG 5362]
MSTIAFPDGAYALRVEPDPSGRLRFEIDGRTVTLSRANAAALGQLIAHEYGGPK